MSKPSDHPGQPLDDLEATQTSENRRAHLQTGDRVADRFEIVRLLGIGAMGEVFEARDQDLDVTVALKVLRSDVHGSADAIARFRQELLTARRVSHPNVIRLHDIVRDQGRWLLTMDYVDGVSLQSLLAREGHLPVEQAVEICKQLARGLAAAHEAGVVHRDLKPANILLTEEGRATISDFGIARSLSHAGLTREGIIVGTPHYLSPEQAAGDPVDGRSDLYALGIILCEMLTGELPFDAITAQEAISQRLVRSPTPLARNPDVPRWLADVCHRLLQRNVRHRYQDAGEVLSDLEAERGRRRRVGRRSAAMAAAVLAALVVVSVYWRFGTGGSDPDAPEVAAAAPSVTTVAVLPDPSATDEAVAVAGRLADRIQELPGFRVTGLLRVATVLNLLQFDAGTAVNHRARVAEELGVRLLVVPVSRADGGMDLQVYSRDDDFERALDASLAAPLLASLLEQAGPLVPGEAEFHQGFILLEYGEAIQALPLLDRAARTQPEAARNWWALARVLESLGRYEEAQDAALQAGARAAGEGRFADLARAWQAVATGDYATADALMQQLLDRYPADAMLHLVAAEYFGDGGELGRAEGLIRTAVELNPDYPRAWYLLGKFAILQGRSQEALDGHLVRALTLQNRLRNRQGQGDVINAQGVAYEQVGQLDEAVDAYTRAAAIRSEVGDRRGEASTLRNLAAIEAIRGDTGAAEDHFEQARALLEQLDDLASMGDLYNDAGFLAEERGDYRKALEHYREALEIRRRLQNQRSVAESLSNVGYVSFELGQFGTARAYLEQSLALYGNVGDQAGQVHARQNLALLELALGELAEVGDRLDEVVPVAESLQMSQELAVNRIIRAELSLQQGRLTRALELADQAREAFAALGDTRGQVEALLLAGRVHLALGDRDAANEVLDAGILNEANADQVFDRSLLQARLALARGELSLSLSHLAGLESQSEINELAVRLLRLAADDPGTPAPWDDVVAEANDLGHRPLLLEVTRQAVEAALRRGDVERARALFESRWPDLESAALTLDKPLYAGLTEALCPVAGRDCASWTALRQEIWSTAAAAAPADHRDGYRVWTGLP